jgi:DNA-directed RNA polymerase subunit RPC12/RpoP
MASPSDKRITVVCACGAKLVAPAASIGKRAKCGKCGQAVLVKPAPEPAAPPASGTLLSDDDSHGTAITMTAAESGASGVGMDPNVIVVDGKVRFSCLCGARLKMPAELAGQRAKCPRCGAANTIPEVAPPAPSGPRLTGNLDSIFDALAKGERVDPHPPGR